MRMQITTRAPLALPSLVVGIVAILLLFTFSALFGMLAGIGAAMMGGIAWSDTRSHGYQGHGFAVAGIILGACAVALGILGMVAINL
ncbi:hypothetical protein [Solirubrobacter phytolaccae]|nr:hypothetical protein [Solirubrobacter phytolaccae]